MQVLIPVSNDATLQITLGLGASVAPGDWFLLDTGGVSRPADPAAVQRRAEQLASTFPQALIYAFTSGLANIERLSGSLHAPVRGIFYDYEPNYPNEPEFSFDAGVTSQNLTRATGIARGHGLQLIGYLTGRCLLNPQQSWNYASFRGTTDGLVLQTQSTLKRGRWGEALERVSLQFGADKPTVQITVAPGLPNAVDIPTAMAAYDELLRRGFTSVVIWWLPTGDAELRAMLGHRALGSGPPGASLAPSPPRP